MILLGLFFGIYGFLLYQLGLAGVLSLHSVQIITICFLVVLLYVYWRSAVSELRSFPRRVSMISLPEKVFVVLLFFMGLINILGVLGPEISFDALWYHLTLAKLYILQQTGFFVPGGLLYYSAMPRLGEFFYVGALSFGESYAKGLHFLFGVFTVILVYHTTRLFAGRMLSFFACMIFYSNLVVGWESISGYVDLMWTFFVTASIYLLLRFSFVKQKQLLYLSGIFVGLAVSIKILALGSLALLLATLLFLKMRTKESGIGKRDFVYVGALTVILAFPWLLFSYIHTGNPVYPFFTERYPSDFSVFSLQNFRESVTTFVFAADPVSPLYLICLPLIFIFRKQFLKKEYMLLFMCAVAVVVWFLTPKSGGGRFAMVFLPLFSVLIAVLLERIKKYTFLFKYIVFLGIALNVFSVGYRSAANMKYIPFLIGQETRSNFLIHHLNFSFGDFYDTDHFFKKMIGKDEVVLLIGFHNLYYVDFPYIDQSWVRKGDTFSYVAVQEGDLPNRFTGMKKIYENSVTRVRLYKGEAMVW